MDGRQFSNSANKLEVQWFKNTFIPDELHEIVSEEICTRTDKDTCTYDKEDRFENYFPYDT